MASGALTVGSKGRPVTVFRHEDSVPFTQVGRFLATMEQLLPWSAFNELVRPLFSSDLMVQSPSYPLGSLMRLYFLRRWFGLDDAGVVDGIADSAAMGRFVGLEAEPDLKKTLRKFRVLVESHGLADKLERLSSSSLVGNGYTLAEGSLQSPRLLPLQEIDCKLQVLKNFFATIEKPYGLSEIFRFNAIYRELYPDLTVTERLQAERYVDLLIDGVEQPTYAAKIFGVV